MVCDTTATHAYLRLMHQTIAACTCTNEWHQLVLSAFPAKAYAGSYKLQLRSNLSSVRIIPRQFPSYWWYFKHNTSLTCYVARLAEERKKMNNSDFEPFQVGHLDTSYYCYCRLGQPILIYTSLHKRISKRNLADVGMAQ